VACEDLTSRRHAWQATNEVVIEPPRPASKSIQVRRGDCTVAVNGEMMAVEAIYEYQHYIHDHSFCNSTLLCI